MFQANQEMFTPSIFIAPRSLLARFKDSTGMADLKRKVTTLSGGGVKPLRLEAVASARPSERVELRETRPSGKILQKRILPVNENRLSFDFKPADGKLIKKPKLGFDRLDSTTEYNEFMVFDQGGTATIGSSNTRENFLVAIKRKKVSACVPKNHPKHQVHDNVVSLFELFYEGNEVCMIYEQMDVSLRHLTGTCEGQWDDYKIGAICKEVGSIARRCFQTAYFLPIIHGLLYIHDECSLYHGALACDTVLLNRDGFIKIGGPHTRSKATPS